MYYDTLSRQGEFYPHHFPALENRQYSVITILYLKISDLWIGRGGTLALRSMTAFGVGEATGSLSNVRCEIKTLNSRFIDLNVRMPRFLQSLENEVMATVKNRLVRGKVDISFDVQIKTVSSSLPRLNEDVLNHYLNLIHQSQILIQKSPYAYDVKTLSLADLFRMEGVLEGAGFSGKSDEAVRMHQEPLMQSLHAAIDSVIRGREQEGQALKSALTDLVEDLGKERLEIQNKRAEVQLQLFANYRKRLEKLIEKLKESGQHLPDSVPEDRMVTEITLLSDKTDIEEELTRLVNHEQEFVKTMANGDDVGRKLDFLCQEMHREVNTMSNKLVTLDISRHTLTMKQTIERIRQQVQNIE